MLCSIIAPGSHLALAQTASQTRQNGKRQATTKQALANLTSESGVWPHLWEATDADTEVQKTNPPLPWRRQGNPGGRFKRSGRSLSGTGRSRKPRLYAL